MMGKWKEGDELSYIEYMLLQLEQLLQCGEAIDYCFRCSCCTSHLSEWYPESCKSTKVFLHSNTGSTSTYSRS